MSFRSIAKYIYRNTLYPVVNQLFLEHLMQRTGNFINCRWLGVPIRQNILDLWTTQETIAEIRPDFLIETGSFHGGSALFYAHLFDLMGNGRVISIDVAQNHDVTHPRIQFWTGSSIDYGIHERLRKEVSGQIMVILDSAHDATHVRQELELYAPLVTAGSYFLVQDGISDIHPLYRKYRPGPLVAIKNFLSEHEEFEVDQERTQRFVITHHPMGWLRRKH